MLNYILLLVGFVLLIKGADIFVESASSVARKFNISPIFIGCVICAIGTSAPEAAISITSSLRGMNDMSIANVVGSNIFNLLVVLGVSSMFNKLKISNFKDVITLLGTCILLLLYALDGNLSLLNGIVLLISFGYFIFNMIKNAKNDEDVVKERSNKSLLPTIILGLLGLGAIIYGGDMVVDTASTIALQLGMSENLVALTICSIGSSLPELVTSVMATRKGELDIAIGNVLGSNIFNILLILGCVSVINPMIVSTVALIDVIFMVITVILFVLATYKNKVVSKKIGISMVILYAMYIVMTIIR